MPDVPGTLTGAVSGPVNAARGEVGLQGARNAHVRSRSLGVEDRGFPAVRPAPRTQAGAEVTGVDNASKLDFMRSVGADKVIDYRREDFTRSGPYDLILDLVAHRSVFAYRRALAPGGRYRCVGGSVRTLLRVLTIGSVAGWLTRRRLGVLAVKEGPAHFGPVADLCAAGDLAVHIDRTFTLDQVPEALAHVGEGRARGKVVVTVT